MTKKSTNKYIPPKVWQWDAENGGKWAGTNRPVAGHTHEKTLPRGDHDLQLYSMATPNGAKVTILLEELLAIDKDGEYDAFLINIMEGDQFGSEFVEVNPNSKIPALLDYSTADSIGKPTRVFESGSILLYLAEKFDAFIPKESSQRAECLSWLFWQMGSAPYLGGGFGHFYNYAPEQYEYPINRFAMEAKRQLDVLDKHLANNEHMCGAEYSIADIAIWPWYGVLTFGTLYNAAEFLDTASYMHLNRWAQQIQTRPAVQRGRIVNRTWGEENEQLQERHCAQDIDEVLSR